MTSSFYFKILVQLCDHHEKQQEQHLAVVMKLFDLVYAQTENYFKMLFFIYFQHFNLSFHVFCYQNNFVVI
jgi:hypothetical protein